MTDIEKLIERLESETHSRLVKHGKHHTTYKLCRDAAAMLRSLANELHKWQSLNGEQFGFQLFRVCAAKPGKSVIRLSTPKSARRRKRMA